MTCMGLINTHLGLEFLNLVIFSVLCYIFHSFLLLKIIMNFTGKLKILLCHYLALGRRYGRSRGNSIVVCANVRS